MLPTALLSRCFGLYLICINWSINFRSIYGVQRLILNKDLSRAKWC